MSHIQLLGQVSLWANGACVVPRSAKELGLLAVLAEAHPRPVTRSLLCRLLWPESDPDRARRSLNQAVYAVRRLVGADALRARLDLVALEGSVWTCDLWNLDQRIEEAGLTKTPVGRFAHTGKLPTTAPFADWVDRCRARIDAHLVSAYCSQLGKLMDRGRYEAVEPLARAVLEIDPYAETGLYHLVLATAGSGRITAALGELEQARERFRTDLDRPLPAVFDALDVRLKTAEAFEATRQATGACAETSAFPFVGREKEFAILRAAWQDLAETGSRVALVSGEPGIGKTRLVDRLARLASIEGGTVLYAECFSAHRRLAFAAIAEVLRGLRQDDVSRLEQIWRRVLFSSFALEAAGTDLAPPPRLDPAAEQLRILEASALAIQTAASRRPVLVIVDDLQWIDQSSAAVIQHLIRRGEEAPVLFLFAARTRELRVNDDLRQFISNNRSRNFISIELNALERTAARDLIEAAGIDEELVGERAEQVALRLDCHPFLITTALREGLAKEISLEPSFPATRHQHLSAPISEYFGAKLSSLDDAEKDLATTLAIWGRPVSFSELTAYLECDERDLIATVERLTLSNVASLQKNTIDFRHDLYRDWLYAESSTPRRVCEHNRIAVHLSGQPKASKALVAVHFDAAGKSREACYHALVAASELRGNGAFAEAEHFLRMALRHAGDEITACECQFQLAEHLFQHAGQNECRAIYERLSRSKQGPTKLWAMARARLAQLDLESSAKPSDVHSRAWEAVDGAIEAGVIRAAVAGLSAATRSLWYGGSKGGCSKELGWAQRLLPQAANDSLEAEVECVRAAVLASVMEECDPGQRTSIRRLLAAPDSIPPATRAALLHMDGFVEWMRGSLVKAEDSWSKALTLAEEAGHVTLTVTTRINLAVAQHYRSPQADVDPSLQAALTEATKRGLIADAAVLTANRALFAWENTRPNLARRILQAEADHLTAKNGHGSGVLLAVAGFVALHSGKGESARRYSRAALETLFEGQTRSQDPAVSIRLARRLARSQDELAACERIARRALESTVHSQVCGWRLELELASCVGARGDRVRAATMADVVIQAARDAGANRVVARALSVRGAAQAPNSRPPRVRPTPSS